MSADLCLMLCVEITECSSLPVGRRLRPSTDHPDLVWLDTMMKHVAYVSMPLLVVLQDIRPKTQVVIDGLRVGRTLQSESRTLRLLACVLHADMGGNPRASPSERR